MVASFDVLALELRESFGEDGPLPTSTRLRSIKRHDLDYVSAAHAWMQIQSLPQHRGICNFPKWSLMESKCMKVAAACRQSRVMAA